MDEITEEQRSVIDRVEKLLRLAGKNTNEAEAASATAKAMELLAQHNLDLSSVDESEDGSGKRAEEKLTGGFYEFERDLWERIADLNFCLYWHQKTWVKRTKIDARSEALKDPFRRRNILRGQHKLVGRTVNVAATKAMASYIFQAIERLTADRLRERLGQESVNTQMRSRWAISYREGIASRLAEKLWDRRQQQIAEERERAEEARRRAEEAGMAGASDSTALTLSTLRKSEREANIDFVYGEGTSARWAADRAEAARQQAEADAAYTAWAEANPEEARREEAKRQARERRRSARSWRAPKEKERDWGAFKAGYSRGDEIGLDPQADRRRAAGMIGG